MTAVEGAPRTTGWTPDDSSFGARLALVRQRMQWGNVKEAATACGLPVESWRTWERDNVQPRRVVEIAATIAERTGCDYGWLLAGRRLQGADGGNTLRYRQSTERPMQQSGPRGRDQVKVGPQSSRPRVLPRPKVG